jgi:phage tail tape-measure protein
MPDSGNHADAAQTWRNWLSETERQWNAFFNDVMDTDAFGRFVGGYMEIYGTLQRLVGQNIERSLSTFNVPTRSDIVDLSERLGNVEERLTSIESSLRALAEALGHPAQPAAITRLRPRRTRRPPGQPSRAL